MSDLLLPLGWVISGGFRRNFAICLLICPVLPQLLGLVFCSYWAPWNWKDQFLAYMPGNVFLAAFVAGSSTMFRNVDVSPASNVSALVCAFGAWVFLGVGDCKVYTRAQRWSANKVYHNLLYFWYGYLAAVCFITLWWAADGSVALKLYVTLPGLVWLGCLIGDNLFPEDIQKRRFALAHADNQPIWVTKRMTGRWLRKLQLAA